MAQTGSVPERKQRKRPLEARRDRLVGMSGYRPDDPPIPWYWRDADRRSEVDRSIERVTSDIAELRELQAVDSRRFRELETLLAEKRRLVEELRTQRRGLDEARAATQRAVREARLERQRFERSRRRYDGPRLGQPIGHADPSFTVKRYVGVRGDPDSAAMAVTEAW